VNDKDLLDLIQRGEKTAFALGTVTGQLSNLLNSIASSDINKEQIYKELKDIWQTIGMQVHGIYYREDLDRIIREEFQKRSK
jgi:hypothetical protein